MNKNILRRYELLVYICISLLSALLFVIGSYVIKTGTVNGVILNLCSELLGVAIVFFIVNRMFPISGSDNSDQHQFSKDIEKIHKSLTAINQDITKLTKKIIYEIDEKQEQLLKLVGEKFSEETSKSDQNLRKAIEYELRMSLNQHQSQSQTVERLLELVGHSIQAMGHYQRSAIEEGSRKVFADMQQSIGKPSDDLSNKVEILQKQVQEVQKQINLPVKPSLPSSN
jgi:hypothetical protein